MLSAKQIERARRSARHGWRRSWRVCGVTVLLMVSGCATQTTALLRSSQDMPPRVALANTPYFEQDAHQCGPASLAMVLVAAGFSTTPEALESSVYVPGRQGSLQAEMLAAARRQGALALRVKPQMTALLAEVAQGNPVVVLQNLGLSWLPRWHYAVVIGYDLRDREILLRSGPHARESMALTTFEHTWARSGYWGLLATSPENLPVYVDSETVANALAALEKYSTPQQMVRAYQNALTRWPGQAVLQMGLGNSAYQMGDLQRAEAVFRSMIDRDPLNAAALNNLATVLQDQRRLDEALLIAERASDMASPWQAQAVAMRNRLRDALNTPRH